MLLKFYLLLLLLFYRRCLIAAKDVCPKVSQFKPRTILLAHQSISAGAEFLKKMSAFSLDECYFACCSEDKCTSALYKSKPPQECFLFDCTSADLCVYAPHEKYDVVTLKDTDAEKPVSGKMSSRNPDIPLEAAELDEHCDRHKLCSANNSVCTDGTCMCQLGWIKKGAVCVRSVCQMPGLQFQCNDSSTCVAIYDRCNGIIECPDGSDEYNCPSSTPTTPESPEKTKTAVNFLNFSHPSEMQLLPRDLKELSLKRPRHGRPADDYDEQRGRHRTIDSQFLGSEDPINEPSFRRGSSKNYHLVGKTHRKPVFVRENEKDLLFDGNQPDISGYASPRADWYQPDEGWPYGSREKEEQLTNSPALYSIYHRRSFIPHPPRFAQEVPELDQFQTLGHSYRDRIRIPSYMRSIGYEERPGYQPYGVESDEDVDLGVPQFPRGTTADERIIDPSVFRAIGQNKRKPTTFSVLRMQPEAEILKNAEKSSSASNQKINGDKTSQPSNPTQIKGSENSPEEVLSVLQRSQSEGHTAALILAFSLGLICCFVGLLVAEWKRRHRAHGWGSRRRQVSIPVLFGDREKMTVIRSRPNKRIRPIHTNVPNSLNNDEESKALCEGLVL